MDEARLFYHKSAATEDILVGCLSSKIVDGRNGACFCAFFGLPRQSHRIQRPMKSPALFVSLWIVTAATVAAQKSVVIDTRGPVQNANVRMQVD